MLTPNAIDSYSRYMDALFNEKEIYGTPTVWLQFFGKPAHAGSKTVYSPNSEVIDIDIKKGNLKLAKLIHRGTDSRNLNVQKNTVLDRWSTFSRVFPLGEELGDITASQLNKRMAGENPYDQRSKFDRMRDMAREHHLEHIRRYVRLFEVLAGASIFAGQHPAISGSVNPDDWYDFRRNSAHIATPTTKWDATGGDPLKDIDAACRLGLQNGKVKFNVAFFGQNVFPVFIDNLKVQTLADNRRFELIQVSSNYPVPAKFQPLIDGGANCRGMLRTPEGNELWMFTYVDIYQDDDGAYQHLMPLNSCLLAFYGARCDRYFGPSEKLMLTSTDMAWYQEMFGFSPMSPPMPMNIQGSGIVAAEMFYCDAYRSGDNKKVTIRTQTAPIFATTQTDAFFTYYGCLESEAS